MSRRPVLARGAAALERLHLSGPAFRAYERWQARRSGRMPDVGKDGLPFPPAHLQVMVSGYASPSLEAKGAEAAASIRELLARAGADIHQLSAVLDFGIGFGRIARHWATVTGPEWHGCDINPALVMWCQDNLPFVKTIRTGLAPPLPYPDARFDFVYAYSVFTHLPETAQHTWIAELGRVLRPGGLLLFTTHGDATRASMEPALRARYDAGRLAVRFPRDAGSNLCSAFHPPRWVHDELLSSFDSVESVYGGMPGFGSQDSYLVRKPETPVTALESAESPASVP